MGVGIVGLSEIERIRPILFLLLHFRWRQGTIDYEQYDYDTNSGYLYRIQFNGATVWQLTNMDEYLRTRQATIGITRFSGYTLKVPYQSNDDGQSGLVVQEYQS